MSLVKWNYFYGWLICGVLYYHTCKKLMRCNTTILTTSDKYFNTSILTTSDKCLYILVFSQVASDSAQKVHTLAVVGSSIGFAAVQVAIVDLVAATVTSVATHSSLQAVVTMLLLVEILKAQMLAHQLR